MARPDNFPGKHHQGLLDLYDPGHRAIQLNWRDARVRRFRISSEPVRPETAVRDIDRGIGDHLDLLRVDKGSKGRYPGLDFVPESVDYATQRTDDDEEEETSFRMFDARFEGFPRGYDVVWVSGTFNNLADTAWSTTIGLAGKSGSIDERFPSRALLSRFPERSPRIQAY